MADLEPGQRYDPPDSPRSVGWVRAQHAVLADADRPFRLEAGGELSDVVVEYETYGELAPAGDNVVLIEHALTGDAHVAGWDAAAVSTGRHFRQRKPGWWDAMVGPGKPIDTRRYHVICTNILGSCYGTTGPASCDPATGRPYALSFPLVQVEDCVNLQRRLLDHLGIERIHTVVGGSLGGQQALEWALAYPDRVGCAVCLAAAPRLSTQGLAFNAVGRYAITTDPHFANGNYYDRPARPNTGLAVARMLAHITYLSEEGMAEKFGRRRTRPEPSNPTAAEFEVESYLDHQGRSFIERFDANSYLYITRATDYYDAAERWGGGDLAAACDRIRSRVVIASFSSDWLFTPAACCSFAMALCQAGRPVTYIDLPSRFGHDAFLVETEAVGRLLRGILGTGGAP
jgi:homoserine O-acetyltransferase